MRTRGLWTILDVFPLSVPWPRRQLVPWDMHNLVIAVEEPEYGIRFRVLSRNAFPRFLILEFVRLVAVAAFPPGAELPDPGYESDA